MSGSKASSSRTEGTDEALRQYRHLYQTADQFAREVAEFRQAVSIPAHNELRYAGHHLLQALGESGTVADEEQLRRACSHCERAMYEAAEAGIISVLQSIAQFQRDYKDLVVAEVVPTYRDCKAAARKAQGLLIRGRSKGVVATETTAEYMHAFRELRGASDLLEDARDDLNAKLRDQKRDARRFFVTTVVGLLGVAATVALIVYRLLPQN